jgi:hypothetical protein
MEEQRITYVGPARLASDLAQELTDRGLSSHYNPPMERKDFATAMAAVSVVFSVTGSLPDIIAATKAFLARHEDVQINGLPEEPEPTVEDRLAVLERLWTDRVVTDDEYRSQRDRILGEL